MDALLTYIVKSFLDYTIYLYDDEEVDIVVGTVLLPKDRVRIPKIGGYVEHVIPSLSSEYFKMHFRMKPSTFEYILNEIGDKLCRTSDGNEMIPADKQFLLSLWRFATPDSYRSIIERFGVGKATGVRAVRRVAKALCELSPRYITWPTENKIQDIIHNFSRPSGFPNVIGAIDGSHINIPAPTENPEAYVNRKGRHSIHLQAVCDHARLFTHIYVGNVGSVHDARVFRLSPLQEYINDANKFPNDTHIIGDAAYTLHQHLLVPYVDNGHLTQRQKNYNFCHSSARMVIERAFALLKGRWRSLLHVLAVNDIEFVPYHILACCVLHNICLLQKDELELEEIFIVDREEAILREERINDNNRYIAELKRNNICANLRMRNA